MGGIVIWITGLPGSGKSTVADELKSLSPDFVILRMDDLRSVITPLPSYSDEEREIVYRSIVFSAKLLSDLGHDVIIDATGNRRSWRELARKIIPVFAEAYLSCPIDVCRKREAERADTHGAPKHIYDKGDRGDPVPGLNVTYEEPLNAEIVIEESLSAAEAAKRINDYISALKK